MTDERTAAQPAAQIKAAGQEKQGNPGQAISPHPLAAPAPAAPSPTPWTEKRWRSLSGHAIEPDWPSSGGRQEVVDADFARSLEALCRQQQEALEAFRSGATWGTRLAWIVNGAPTRSEGIMEAKAIVSAQTKADEVCVVYERLKKEIERG